MKKSSIFVVFSIFLGILVLISTMSTVSATDVTILSPTGVIQRSDPIIFILRMTDYSPPSFGPGFGYGETADIVIYDGAHYILSSSLLITHNGDYSFSIPSDQLPFDEHTYNFIIYINSSWDFNGDGIVNGSDIADYVGMTGADGWIPADVVPDGIINYLDISYFVSDAPLGYTRERANGNFSINGFGASWSHEISLKDFNPPAYNLLGMHVMRDGFRWSMTDYGSTQTVYLFLCNATRKLIAYGTRTVTYTNNGTYTVGGVLYDKGFTWHDYQGKTSYQDISFYIPRAPYYEYVGVRTDDGSHSWANTRVTMLDDTGVGGDTRELNWSLDAFTVGSDLYHNSVAHSYDFQGYFTYFETMPAAGESLGGGIGTPGQAGWVGLIRGYFAGFNMVWMMYMLGFIVVCAFVGPTYAFARKFNISIPNFIYVLMIVVGVTAAWVIGFFDTWIYVFFLAIVLLSLVIKFREPIEQAVLRGEMIKGLQRATPKRKLGPWTIPIKIKKVKITDTGLRPEGKYMGYNRRAQPSTWVPPEPIVWVKPVGRQKMTEEEWVSRAPEREAFKERAREIQRNKNRIYYNRKKGGK